LPTSVVDHRRTNMKEPVMTDTTKTIRTILGADSLTCLGAGAVMSLGAGLLAGPTGLHPTLLLVAGLSLFPVAALFGWMAKTRLLNGPLVMLAVIGNAGWVAASIAVLLMTEPTVFGTAFVLAQALVVALLAWLEFGHRPRAGYAVAA
jgi:O-antigen/teichoic acid export membrane protein